ncbi:MAG: TonB-dependent receptor [Ferruginibacter sp.]|nr:TonB-dependent receptor [Ferruginibacter sp.]
MKQFLTLLALSGISLSSFAQSAGKISGAIKDGGNQKIIDAASVSLLRAKDSSLVKLSVADKDGNFSFENVKEGSYLVLATSVGHTKVYSQPIQLTATSTNAETGTLQLVPVDKKLSEVIVTAKKPFIERKLDKMILNVEGSISNTGSTAMEVLEKAPGVSVDKDGNISLKGKQGVIVMIDGKPSYMAGADLANFLRSLPSSNLDQIEIMTNPSSKYDASGNSGIINIKTKKNKQKGFNGSMSLAYGQGVYSKTNNSLNLNYRVGKVNIFSTVSANYRKSFQQLDILRAYSNADKTPKAIFRQNTSTKKENYNYNAKIGMDFYATKKTTLGFVFTGYTTPGKEHGNSTSYLQSYTGVTDSIVTALRAENNKWKNGAINLNLRHSFDSTGRELTADVDYLQYKADKDQRFVNAIYNPDWTSRNSDILLGELPSDIKVYSAKLDYTHPLKKELKLETGAKFSYVTTDNDAGYFNMSNGIKTVDFKRTNRFTYKENVNALYVNLSKTIKKWGLQAGLRIENTNYKGHQFGNAQRLDLDSSFSRSYTNAFPTTYISYNANDKNQFGFSYGRRINRPDYEDLNPFLFFLDKYTYGEGNPFLKPMYSNVVELSHTYHQWLTTNLNYSHTKDLFNETFRQNNQPDDSLSTIVRQGNYGISNNISLSVNAQLKIAKWFTSMIYTEARYQEFKGELNGENLNVQSKNFGVNINNQFTFKKGWSAEASGFYRTKASEGQMTIGAISQVSFGVKKDVLKNKGSLKLGVRDAFGPMKVHGNINFQNTAASFQQYNDNRVATLSFNYRFGKPIKGLKNRKSGGAGDEQNRIKSAN